MQPARPSPGRYRGAWCPAGRTRSRRSARQTGVAALLAVPCRSGRLVRPLMRDARICLIGQARIAVLDALRDLVFQGADHRRGGAGVVSGGSTDLAAQSVALVADGDPADAVWYG
jgi:hypothetical protein